MDAAGAARCSAKGTLHILAPAEAQRLASLRHRTSQRSPLKPRVVGCQPPSACRTVDVLCISRRNLAAVKNTAQDTKRSMRSLAASRHGASPPRHAPWRKHVRPHCPHMSAMPASKAIHPSKRMLDIRLHLAKTKSFLRGWSSSRSLAGSKMPTCFEHLDNTHYLYLHLATTKGFSRGWSSSPS